MAMGDDLSVLTDRIKITKPAGFDPRNPANPNQGQPTNWGAEAKEQTSEKALLDHTDTEAARRLCSATSRDGRKGWCKLRKYENKSQD